MNGEEQAALVQVLCLVLGAALGTGARAVVLARVAAAGGRVARWGTAWVNVPAAFAAALALTWVDASPLVVTAAALGVCGGLSTWSSLALEVATALRAADRARLRSHGLGILLGLLAGLAGTGLGVVTRSLLG